MSPPTSPAVRLLESAIDAGTVPGGIIAHGRDPEPVARGAVAPGGAAFPADAIVRIQSMTKAIQAVAALRLVERGVLALDSPVVPWLPELAAPRVLPRPDADLDQAVPSPTEITLRHLLTCTSGLGIATAEGPLQRAMAESGLEAGSAPWTLAADEWLAALGALPLAGEPGRVWRYHHSFSVLGILLSRVTGSPLDAHLRADLLDPLGMVDTGSFVPAAQSHRLPPAFTVEDGEPAETTDQVPSSVKQPDSFYPGFWDGTGWGFGVCVVTDGEHRGRWRWSGGFGTDFFVDADGTIGLLLAQVEIGEHLMPLLEAFQDLPTPPN